MSDAAEDARARQLGQAVGQELLDGAKSGGMLVAEQVPGVSTAIAMSQGDLLGAALDVMPQTRVARRLYRVTGVGVSGSSVALVPRTGPVGIVEGRYNANVMVRDPNGKVVTHTRLVSGNQTAEELAMGFPKGSLASHTEARTVRQIALKPGDQMTIVGQNPPCPSCKGQMKRTSKESGATITHQWREKGSTQTWTARP